MGERDATRTAFTEALEIYRRPAQQHPAASEPNVAMTLSHLGTVLSDLGERDAARTAYTEALEIYWRLLDEWPQAFSQSFLTALQNYLELTDEDAEDPWWQFWNNLQEGDETGGEQEA